MQWSAVCLSTIVKLKYQHLTRPAHVLVGVCVSQIHSLCSFFIVALFQSVAGHDVGPGEHRPSMGEQVVAGILARPRQPTGTTGPRPYVASSSGHHRCPPHSNVLLQAHARPRRYRRARLVLWLLWGTHALNLQGDYHSQLNLVLEWVGGSYKLHSPRVRRVLCPCLCYTLTNFHSPFSMRLCS